jgi:parvulin-like peptidyl-prolyl isomerase
MRTRWYKDPLVAFLAAGTLLFVIAGDMSEDAQSNIEVRNQDIDRLAQQWAAQMQREPNQSELQGLLDQHIKEEIYYREALRLGLDENDTIVRRRMVQKLTFLTEDLAVSDTPEQQVLQQFHLENSDLYTEPQRYSFQHRYFSTDRRDDAEQVAERALSEDSLAGDPFMLQKQYAQRSQREVGDLFGREFAAALAALSSGQQWQGPLRSAYGWHVVRLTKVLPSRTRSFDETRDRVLADWQQAERKRANADYYQSLSERYDVRLPNPADTTL